MHETCPIFQKIDFKFEQLVQVHMNSIDFTSDDSSSSHVQLIIRINSKIMKSFIVMHSYRESIVKQSHNYYAKLKLETYLRSKAMFICTSFV